MTTRWHRQEYDAEYERHARPERDEPATQTWEVQEGKSDYEPNPSTGYDPEHDRNMRFQNQDWGDLVENGDFRVDPTEILSQDVQVSHAVCDFLRGHPGANLEKIGVYAEAGVVTLRGSVDSLETKRSVLRGISRLSGVTGLVDRLDVS